MKPPAQLDSSHPFTLTQQERLLENTTMLQVGGLLVVTTWAFGGNAPWARILVGCLASVSLPLTLGLVYDAYRRTSLIPRALHLLWPLIGLNVLVLASLLNPGFRVGTYAGETLYIENQVSQFLPSSARPAVSMMSLWLFTSIYLTCFNLILAIKSRRSLRMLLMSQVINGLILSVFGTFQKLTHASGLFFGLQESPQPRFFASFIYHNHWAAYAILMMSIGLGLIFHYMRRLAFRELVQSPALLVGISVTFLAMTMPLSGSRSGSIMAVLLLLIALIQLGVHLLKSNRRNGRNGVLGLCGLSLLLVGFLGVTYKLGEPMIRERLSDTRQQISTANTTEGSNQRLTLYRDTWEMAQDRFLYGWGMGSYPYVFVIYNTQNHGKLDRLPHYYHDAHSDWLQSIAELGLVGTALIAFCGFVPLWHYRRSLMRSPLSNYLLMGTGLLLLYAWVEFPFGNVAVIIAFWLCFFSALLYGRIEPSRSS